MKKRILQVFWVSMGMLASFSAFAEEVATAGASNGLWAIGSGMAMGLGALGGTIGLGLAASAALGGIARNPSAKDQVFVPMILVLALVEFQAIMAFIIAVLWFTK